MGSGLLAHHQAGPSGDASSETGPADAFGELDDRWGLAFASLNLGGALLLHKPRGSAPGETGGGRRRLGRGMRGGPSTAAITMTPLTAIVSARERGHERLTIFGR